MPVIPIRCKSSRSIPYKNLKPFQGNLKEITKANADRLRESILKYGWRFPVFVWKQGTTNWIHDGHGRIKILSDLLQEGYTIGKIPVVDIEAKDKKEAGELLLALNSRYQTITNEGLSEFINEMEIDHTDLDMFDLPDIDIDEFMAGYVEDETADETADDVPEIPESPITNPGDLYQLGSHRLLCGDATKKDDVERLLNGNKADMVFTDPPYNVDYGVSKDPRRKQRRKIKNDKQDADDWEAFCASLYSLIKKYNRGDIYMWGASAPVGMQMRLWLVASGCHWSTTIIWKKQRLTLSPAKYQRMYEPCFYGWFDKSSFCADRKQTEVWEFDRPNKSDLHPTMKPVELCAYGIKNSSKRGDIVLDPFLGSGSTLIACEKTNRVCYGMEIAPGYCDVIVQRWEEYTGEKAELLK